MAAEAFHACDIWLRQGPTNVAAHLVEPAAGTRKIALIVAPLGEERKAAHPALAALARQFAARGIAALRTDERGCGDSPGEFAEATPADWEDDLRAAAAWLKRRHPGCPCFWVGVRISALRVLHAAAAQPAAEQPDGLVLWDPVTGADWMRQLLQRHQVNQMIAHGRARRSRRDLEQALAADGTVDLDGFAVTGRHQKGLAPLTPLAWPHPVLIVTTGPEQATADACQRLAPQATRHALRLPPYWNTVGLVPVDPLITVTADWIAAQPDAASTPPPAPPLPPDAAASDDGERFVALPGARGMLRAVLHPPAEGPSRGRLLFLHGWSGDRTGPHRMFVHAARRLTAQGWTCLRMDLGGRGDSDGPPAEATIATMTADARAALGWLRRELPDGGPLALLAICSGCKAAITAAAAEPDLTRLALWSAEAMGSLRAGGVAGQRRLAMLAAYGRKLLRPETWRKLLRGRIRADMVGRALVQPEVRTKEEARAENATLRSFAGFRGSILFVWGESDPDTPGSSAAYARFCRKNNIAFAAHRVPEAGHSFYGLDWERDVLDATETWLNQA